MGLSIGTVGQDIQVLMLELWFRVFARNANSPNPNNIEQSVLEPGIHFPYSFNKLIIGLLVILFYYFIYFKNDAEEEADLEKILSEGWIGKMYAGYVLDEKFKKDKEK